MKYRALLACFIFCFAPFAKAQFILSDEPPPLTLEVIKTSEPHHAELRFKLAKGWKTYAQQPGEVGIAPQLILHSSENLKSWDWHWPRSKPFTEGNLKFSGYDRDFTVQLILTPQNVKHAVSISGTLEMGTCETLCVPISIPLVYKSNIP